MSLRTFKTALVAAAAMMVSLPASAVLITTDGSWLTVEGTPSEGPFFIDSDGNGTNDILQFGQPFGDINPGVSEYRFEGLTVDAPTDGTLFAIGDFVHENFTILLPSIRGATLRVDLTGPLATSSTDLFFSHFETPNTANPCGAGGAQPCPDEVLLPGTSRLRPVNFEGEDFVLEIVGFSEDGGETIVPSFLTLEGNTNRATLYARLTPVPETGTIALFGLGLLGVGLARRRAAAQRAA